ncbi:GNAT family N-acetyltransferase [Verrucomicrobia bacterium]|jgi:RimJ/RimL family protein N-acetyltransferase|nr:GNAT family N-acetyltransferase [Verrucomicrobiota bacterium]MDA7511554.1 GNAT family N-acetyltransferase [Verrucomicrobiota bacterium]MDA7667470.1 GNAT family N-acetyltransferase [bacterium]MDB4798195.1 GNAT family N-acetyltransferase [Verrucomicrobiota bacterium]
MDDGLSILNEILEVFPKELQLESGLSCHARPLTDADQTPFWDFFQAVPQEERVLIKHHVHRPEVIAEWCSEIDYGRNLPILALVDGQVIGVCTLHQQLGGWKRHIGRISVFIHPLFRGRGIAKALVSEVVGIAQKMGLEKLEAEFIAAQERAIRVFALIGFSELLRMEDYVRDMQAISHDYVLMGMDLTTDEEYASAG